MTGNKSYLDPVGRRVDAVSQEFTKNLITLYGASSTFYQTRMMESTFTEFSPRYERHNNALLLPYRSNYHIPEGGFFEHWAYTNELGVIAIADHYKPTLVGYKDHSMLPVYPFKKSYPIKHHKGDFYYMGLLNPHYGHFIQESVTRYWLALQEAGTVSNNTKFVFHVMANASNNLLDEIYDKNIHQYLSALGITKDKVVFVRGPSSFESITVPESSIAISDGNCYVAKEARNVWRYINQNMSQNIGKSFKNRPSKVYISRSAVKNPIQGRVLINEKELELLLKKRGFTIVIPEAYDQQEMQVILSEVEVIVGAPGSGLQNSFFIPGSAITLGLTTEAIAKINPGLNHQIHTDKICGHKTHAYIADVMPGTTQGMEWVADLTSIENILDEKGI